MSKKIHLTRGKFVIVDDADYEWLSQWKWCAFKNRHTCYAIRSSPHNNSGRRTSIWMHREILGLKPGDLQQGDHRDGNGLNNQRSNLRVASHTQNRQNQKSRKGTSRFKGVSWYQYNAKWRAQIRVNSRKIHLGYFDNEIEAAQMYDKIAKMFFGEFARTNF